MNCSVLRGNCISVELGVFLITKPLIGLNLVDKLKSTDIGSLREDNTFSRLSIGLSILRTRCLSKICWKFGEIGSTVIEDLR